MVKHCIAFGCTNRSSKHECKELSWHSLPLLDKRLLAEWLVKIRRENCPVTKNSYVCSQHFEPACFIRPVGGQRIRLKLGSVPSRSMFSVKKSERKRPCYRGKQTATTVKLKTNKTATTAAKSALEVFDSTLQNNEASPVVESGETGNVFVSGEFVENENDKLARELRSKEEKLSKAMKEWQEKELELTNKIKELERQLELERNVRKELEMLNSKKHLVLKL